MSSINLPFWLSGDAVDALKKAADAFWATIRTHAGWQAGQQDAMTCDEPVLELMAWERDITRLKNEDLALYRKRVKYAYHNAKDAGSYAGMLAIFQRLGVDILAMYERVYPQDWDVITIHATEQQLSENGELLHELIRQYGRTTRRYEFSTNASTVQHLAVWEFAGSQEFSEVTYEP
ncbi:phage tail protein [Bowmanella denitrificans]|uniref:phage tail protein n=1 Tax=Bowmanella denitrificans TaxID=366582 RepID=UPI000C9A4418|nr:phage tail protein [Bowmanella denitrificans]